MSYIGLFPLVGDLLHAGHLLALKEAKEICGSEGKLVVALNAKPDGKNPVETVYERFVRLKSCRWVDDVIVYSGEKDLDTICRTFNYNIRFIGSDHTDWTGKDIEIKRGIESYTISRVPEFSSTDLKNRIINQQK